MSKIHLPQNIPERAAKESYPYTQSQEIYLRRILITVAVVALTGVVLWVLWKALNVVLLVFGGLLLAIFLRAITQGVKRVTHLPDKAAVLLVIVLLLALLVGTFWLIGPQITGQLSNLRESAITLSDQIVSTVREYGWGQQLLDWLPIQEFVSNFPAGATSGGIFSTVTGVFSQTLDMLSALLLVLGIGIFFAFDPGLYMRGAVRLFPHRKRKLVWEVLRAEEHALRGWLLGTVISMSVIGISTTLLLWAFNVPLALPMGVFVALLEFIPILGTVLGTIPVVLLAVTVSPQTALWVFVIYTIIQIIESNILVPLVLQKTIELPPVITLTAQILFGIFAGTLGILLATPIAATLMILIQMVYVRHLLGDPIEVHKTVN